LSAPAPLAARLRATLAALALLLGVVSNVSGAAELKPWGGDPGPLFALRDANGREHRLEDYRGKVVLLNFWATWCEPCRNEMPSLDRLGKALAGQPFAILAIDLGESDAAVKRFLEQVPVGFPVLLDRDMAVAKGWSVRLLPVTIVLDAEGYPRYRAIGEVEWDAPSVEKRLRALLPKR
jgi:thiol-disulfide isomerase/thioredoxin